MGISQTQCRHKHTNSTTCDYLYLAQLFQGHAIVLQNHRCVLGLCASFFSRDNFLLLHDCSCPPHCCYTQLSFHCYICLACTRFAVTFIFLLCRSGLHPTHLPPITLTRNKTEARNSVSPATFLTLFLYPLNSNPT